MFFTITVIFMLFNFHLQMLFIFTVFLIALFELMPKSGASSFLQLFQ